MKPVPLLKRKYTPELKALDYVYSRLGLFYDITPGESKRVKNADFQSFLIDAFPRIRFEDIDGNKVGFNYYFPQVGEILVSVENLEILEASSPTEVRMAVEAAEKRTQHTLEVAIMKAEQRGFGRLLWNEVQLSPVKTIAREILERWKSGRKIQPESLQSSYLKWISCMTSSRLLERGETGRISPGNLLLKAYENVQDLESASQIAIGVVMADHYDYLRKGLGIHMMVPYVEIALSYWRMALGADKLVKVSREMILGQYYKIRPPDVMRQMKAKIYIDEIIKNDILVRENGRIYGNEKTFETLEPDREKFLCATPIASS